MIAVAFTYEGVVSDMEIDRVSTLADVQQTLCRMFRKTFPMMKATLALEDHIFDEFIDKPFATCDGGVTFEVAFAPTDDPFFYDWMDRRAPKVTLEDEIAYDEAVSSGEAVEDLRAWLIKQRHQFEPA